MDDTFWICQVPEVPFTAVTAGPQTTGAFLGVIGAPVPASTSAAVTSTLPTAAPLIASIAVTSTSQTAAPPIPSATKRGPAAKRPRKDDGKDLI